MVEVISGPNVLWQLYRPPGITRAFRQKGHTGHREHKTLGHFTFWNKKICKAYHVYKFMKLIFYHIKGIIDAQNAVFTM